MSQDTTQQYPMDAVSRQDFDEWRDHPATKLVMKHIRESVEELKGIVCRELSAEWGKPPKLESLLAMGARISERESILNLMQERSDG